MKQSFLFTIALLLSLSFAAHSDPHYTVSWFGNTFPGAQKWVQQDVHAMSVAPDGTIYTNVGWDEGGREVGVYRNGDVIGKAGHTHGWGYNGGDAVAVNGKYVFIAQSMGNEGGGLKDLNTWPAKGLGWWGVSRRLRTDIEKAAPFEGGKGGQGDTLKSSFLVVSEVPEDTKGGITGLWADETRLYVGDPAAKQVKVYDAETMQLLSSWPLDRPGPMTGDKAGLWILQTGPSPQIAHFSTDGKQLPNAITFPAEVVPTAFCLDNRNRILVADDGPNQQILIYDNVQVKPHLAGTLGQKGGIYAGGRGAFGDWKLNHPTAVGCDAAGNVYVASDGQSGGGGTVLESYAPGGKLNWRLFGLEFVDMADADPASDADVFTKEEHFRMNYARQGGQEWRYVGYTLDRFRYADDPRSHIWSAGAWVRHIAGRRFLFVNDMNAEHLQVYRFEAGSEIATPSGFFAKNHIKQDDAWPPHQPEKGAWIWRDGNGNGAFDEGEYAADQSDVPDAQGWWVDDAGNVWLATEHEGIWEFPLQGLDARGNPMWDWTHKHTFPKPDEFDEVKRLRYDPATDVMMVGGTKGDDKNQHWKPMGPVICRYDNWLKGDATHRVPRWRIVAPYAKGSQGHESCEPMGFDIAGDYLFVPYTGASKDIGFTSGHIEMFKLADGTSAGHMELSPDIGDIGLQDIRECLSVRRRADGEYLVFLEEDWKSKILMYRVRMDR